ncbi:glycosyltransferase [uncultured Bacteroides sp.]|uniref:glycosyltransferase n=1 Tax=uncultured Bacteroides sp. TaxID=162156 RepID=UPI00261BB9D6|nr:glycosyltransferase [uncultured Bacteroides sp.]
MKTLILLTNSFPYGVWEPYLETEVNYYRTVFDRIYVCSLQIRKEFKSKRALPKDFKVIPVYYTSRYIYLFYSFGVLFDHNLYAEIRKLWRTKRLSIGRIVDLFVFLSRSHYEANHILRYFKKNKIKGDSGNGVIYSYRFEYQPYVGILLQKKLFDYSVVARAHGYDLYEERRKVSYIPLRECLLKALDKVILIAQNGVDYLVTKYPEYQDKLVLSRLGTVVHPEKKVETPIQVLSIVSCSNVVPVKRLHLIVQALSFIQDIQVKWTHYGQGVLFDEIISLCKEKLPHNIQYEFKGHIENQMLLKEYEQFSYHLFLNVSSSEGVPVSIMEAMSFGIPCIATNVGGTCEVVSDRYNGILLDADFDVRTLAECIREFKFMSAEDYQNYRYHARRSWMDGYDAEKNYQSFMNMLDKICCK